MPVSPQWEYLTVLLSEATWGKSDVIHPKSVNGQELNDWKKIELSTFLSQLGAAHWEMTGTLSIPRGDFSAVANYLFFKRIKS